MDSGQQVVFKAKWRANKPTGGSGIWVDTIGDVTESNGFVRDDEGSQLGKDKETKARGLFILPLSSSNDPREGWVDFGSGAVVYNVSHPFAKNLDGRFGIAGIVLVI